MPPHNNGEQILQQITDARNKINKELRKQFVGQDKVIEQLIICLFSQGHCLLQGVPGLGKTMLVKTIAKIFSLAFKRIQFTPDLMPADIFGSEIIDTDNNNKRQFRFIKGPIFTNILLADEINRTPPKTQAALLEAMAENHVTAGGQTIPLPQPFFVLATQNPIELEGTYPLPEAQLDRFLMNIVMDYLTTQEEELMVANTTKSNKQKIDTIFANDEISQIQKLIQQIPVPHNVISYAVRLVTSTRPNNNNAPEFIRKQIKWGAGSRASQSLIIAGKARAALHGRYNVACEDIQALALPILRHRIITNFYADAEGITSQQIIKKLLTTIKE